jgi:hypothetical protein
MRYGARVGVGVGVGADGGVDGGEGAAVPDALLIPPTAVLCATTAPLPALSGVPLEDGTAGPEDPVPPAPAAGVASRTVPTGAGPADLLSALPAAPLPVVVLLPPDGVAGVPATVLPPAGPAPDVPPLPVVP